MDVLATTSGQGRIRHYLVKDEPTLTDFLVRRVSLTREEAERLLFFGAVYQQRRRVLSDRPVSPGQYVRVHVDPKRFPVDGVDWSSAVVYRDDNFVVANKPAGIPVHATVDNRVENVLHQLSETLGGPLYVTQRLDTEVGGLIVFAGTRESQREFNKLLVERKVQKRYRALVTSPPLLGRHVHFMQATARSPKTVSATAHPGWLDCALTVVDVRPRELGVFEVEIDLETGRTHQIRAQLSAVGSPILGDALYGATAKSEADRFSFPGIGLFSASASWSLEDKKWRFELKPPWS